MILVQTPVVRAPASYETARPCTAPASGLLEHLDVTVADGSAFHRKVQPWSIRTKSNRSSYPVLINGRTFNDKRRVVRGSSQAATFTFHAGKVMKVMLFQSPSVKDASERE